MAKYKLLIRKKQQMTNQDRKKILRMAIRICRSKSVTRISRWLKLMKRT